MKMLLKAEFPNGVFGDPALFISEVHEKRSLLVDCGDLSRFAPRQLLKVDTILLSHCHMDHFFGFDTYLRVHMGVDKTAVIFGPPGTSDRVAGKLQGYTWNLIQDQKLEFQVFELWEPERKKRMTRFKAKDQFRPSERVDEVWDLESPFLEAGVFRVWSTTLDHRTPSLAYSIEEKETIQVDVDALVQMGLEAGPWINELKREWFSPSEASHGRVIQVALRGGGVHLFGMEEAREKLMRKIFIPRQRHKIVYATDGAASTENKERLLHLARDADLMFSETCFLQRDFDLAEETKHFTAKFIGEVAAEAGIKRVVPFHFSKRYLGCAEELFEEIKTSSQYGPEVLDLRAMKDF